MIALAERVLARRPRLHVLVNNSGVIWGAPTLEFPLEAWDRVFAVNVRGLWLLSQRVARHMKEAGGGSIIHVTSISAFRGAEEEAEPAIAYGASKGAVSSLTLDMAVKLAPHGIRVNAIAPGPFFTDMMNHVRHDPESLREFHEQVPHAPLGRRGRHQGRRRLPRQRRRGLRDGTHAGGGRRLLALARSCFPGPSRGRLACGQPARVLCLRSPRARGAHPLAALEPARVGPARTRRHC